MKKISEIWGKAQIFFMAKISKNLAKVKIPLTVFIIIAALGGNFLYSQKIAAEKFISNKKAVSTESKIVSKPKVMAKMIQPVEAAPTIAPAPVTVPTIPISIAQKKVVKKQAPVASTPLASTQSPAPAPVIATPSTEMDIDGIVSQINYQRQINGLGTVAINSQLNSAAQAKADDMATKNYFAHTAPDGTTDFDFINNSGYQWQAVGINLAMGDFGDAAGLVTAWMNSPDHRANILASFGHEIGIGISGQYYVMMIANPS
jgi:uncharacterized protein YkwD